jgi:hypothetical protein
LVIFTPITFCCFPFVFEFSHCTSLSVFLLLSCSSTSKWHIWEKTCDICFYENGLFHFTLWCLVYLFSHKLHNFILYGWIKLHCVNIPHFLCHASIDGHLGWFPDLIIVTSTIQVPIGISIVSWLWSFWIFNQKWYYWVFFKNFQ